MMHSPSAGLHRVSDIQSGSISTISAVPPLSLGFLGKPNVACGLLLFAARRATRGPCLRLRKKPNALRENAGVVSCHLDNCFWLADLLSWLRD